MIRRTAIIALAAAFGAGASAGVAACGEDRGSVSVEEGKTTGTGKTTSPTAPTETTPTETEPKTTPSAPY